MAPVGESKKDKQGTVKKHKASQPKASQPKASQPNGQWEGIIDHTELKLASKEDHLKKHHKTL